MTKASRRRRKTCHHEAGHALVRWFFGFEVERVVVQTVESVRAGRRLRTLGGRLVTCEGMVSGPDILSWPYGPQLVYGGLRDQAEYHRWRRYRRDVELIDCCAGYHAEAHYGRLHPTAAALMGGGDDIAQHSTVMRAWFPGVGPLDGHSVYEGLHRRVDRWARALVRSPMGSAAIHAMAEKLRTRGRLSGVQVAAVCRDAYGGRECAFEAWAGRWPPTEKQLRDGFIPGTTEARASGSYRPRAARG